MTENASSIEYRFSRPVCLFFTLFGFAGSAAGITISVVGRSDMFVEGFIPGWVFGPVTALLFSFVGISWARRLVHSSPALVLDRDGIRSYDFVGTIRWEEIRGVYPGNRGTTVLDLRDPEALRARQRPLRRLLARLPSLRREGTLSLGGFALRAGKDEVFSHVQQTVDRVRLANHAARLPESAGSEPAVDADRRDDRR